MKKFILFSFVLAGLFVVQSCKKSLPPVEIQNDFQKGLTANDTLQMKAGCDSCMNLLQEGQIDQALNMLYEYNDSLKSVSPLSETTRNMYSKRFNAYKVSSFAEQYYSFQEEGLNDVKYLVQCKIDEGEPIETTFMFNPVRVDGKWYVTVKTADQAIDASRQ